MVAAPTGVTPGEYLAMERAAETKHEYYDGRVYAMSGASREHNLIVGNLVRVLGTALLARPCEVYPSDMRVKAEARTSYSYPDVSVVCGKPRFEDEHVDTLLNPVVVFEVLSDSTEKFDRGKKFDRYRAIASLREYVLVSQDDTLVEVYTRQADATWSLRVHRAGDVAKLASLEVSLAVDEVYAKVFPATPG